MLFRSELEQFANSSDVGDLEATLAASVSAQAVTRDKGKGKATVVVELEGAYIPLFSRFHVELWVVF